MTTVSKQEHFVWRKSFPAPTIFHLGKITTPVSGVNFKKIEEQLQNFVTRKGVMAWVYDYNFLSYHLFLLLPSESIKRPRFEETLLPEYQINDIEKVVFCS